MTDREKFLERWAWTGVCARDVRYCEDYEGCAAAIRHNPQSGIGFEDTRSLTPRMAWARADDAMLARFGEPPNPERDALVLKADAVMRKWQARAKKAGDPLWLMEIYSALSGYSVALPAAGVHSGAPTWYDAVLAADALAESAWQAREGGAE